VRIDMRGRVAEARKKKVSVEVAFLTDKRTAALVKRDQKLRNALTAASTAASSRTEALVARHLGRGAGKREVAVLARRRAIDDYFEMHGEVGDYEHPPAAAVSKAALDEAKHEVTGWAKRVRPAIAALTAALTSF